MALIKDYHTVRGNGESLERAEQLLLEQLDGLTAKLGFKNRGELPTAGWAYLKVFSRKEAFNGGPSILTSFEVGGRKEDLNSTDMRFAANRTSGNRLNDFDENYAVEVYLNLDTIQRRAIGVLA